MTSCPECRKAVDPLRSRFVGVRDGKIVAYCSAECAASASPEAASGGAPRAAAAPARGMASAVSSGADAGRTDAGRALSPSTGVPARLATPAAGVPTNRVATPAAGLPAARAATPVAGVPATLGATPASGIPAAVPGPPPPGVPLGLESGPVIEILHEPSSGAMTSERDEPRARHPDEIPMAAYWSADKEQGKQKDPSATSGDAGAVAAVGEPELAVIPPTGDGEQEVPPTRQIRMFRVASDGELVASRRSRWPLVLVLVLLVCGGGVALYYVYGRPGAHGSSAAAPRSDAVVPRVAPPRATRGTASAVAVAPPHAASAPTTAPAPHPAAAAMAGQTVDPAAVIAQARAVLRSELAATSPRVQRIAAAALARTADPEAVVLLAAQLGLAPAPAGGGSAAANAADDLVTSDIARLGLAYALARAGDSRGRDVLAGALASPRGEARDEASRLLALLGDRRAVPHLLDLLAVEQRRLGAAEHLARLAEPHALQILDQIRGDARQSADDRARATVALGLAGRADVAGALRAMLADPHFNAFAGAALAVLADRAAQPVLEHQLASPPLRVFAARALRRLDPSLDPRPLVPALLDVVRTGRDVDRIPAAEAILVLAGPARWSAYD